ncbi:MAG: hypothetical protein Q8R85_15015 [Bosea sp. (in: a-proteobacteria)]|jgi:hypothetical protein|uniref:hypothetical protein n=1 Tax=unclassified Bosea (in: a-proteobacteria) TaxID=2653178 RepID=UPI00083E6A58|nr:MULTISPECIES: hypothetical protein [unclassified Bosea (in: a-proteobacteria)]MBA4269640.1 hypothetical protein [Methylobacterium sp.]OYW67119.1 MAG: hypothetical protein B7Z40_08445 [Bosea sp. 12-68-7]OYX01644.1 MAG: hypothetical protein B7Z14_05585 [Bosea sp. 32-68-6]AOG06206.1 hypothetical protein BSY19_3202 [Bosea sp. RAC05]MBA4334747.1 hypothetical protein [Methylobacterium sp.]
MAANRFEQVDEPQPDAITLSLSAGDGETHGQIACPAELAGGHLVNDFLSDPMPPVEAFRAAVRLANEIRAPIVVADPQGLWQDDWGVLYREAD